MKKITDNEIIQKLEACCKAFNYIMPEPAKDGNMCKTTSELYKVQFKLAKDMWSDTLKDLNKYHKQ